MIFYEQESKLTRKKVGSYMRLFTVEGKLQVLN